jgi:branched-chain amino acid transport system ATP-binding protein
MLRVANLSKDFGGLRAVDDVTFDVPKGGLSALIGPNGAGKTTCFALVSGFTPADSGRVEFDGRDITGLPPHKICRLGMVRTFQIVQPFAGQTVLENVAVGSHLHRAGRADALAHARLVAHRVGLDEDIDKRASSLPIARRKRLELARALAVEPKVLLLDEVLAGLNPTEVDEMIPVIQGIRDSGVTILMIEHVMQAVVRLAEYVWVLNHGALIARGRPREVVGDPAVIEASLGKRAAGKYHTHFADGAN